MIENLGAQVTFPRRKALEALFHVASRDAADSAKFALKSLEPQCSRTMADFPFPHRLHRQLQAPGIKPLIPCHLHLEASRGVSARLEPDEVEHSLHQLWFNLDSLVPPLHGGLYCLT